MTTSVGGDTTNGDYSTAPLTFIDYLVLGDAGAIVPGLTDGPTHDEAYCDNNDWNNPTAADLANVNGPFALNGETFVRENRTTRNAMGPFTKFERTADVCKFFFGYPWNAWNLRDAKPTWWTGIVRLDCTLARVILALQCVNPVVDGVNGLSAEENFRDWCDFATQPADPQRPTSLETTMRALLLQVHRNAPYLDVRQTAIVAVVRILVDQVVTGPQDNTTAVLDGVVVNVRKEKALRVSCRNCSS